MDLPSSGHDPVLIKEVLSTLDVRPGMIFVDCTLGRAGHASIVTKMLGATGTFIGLDVDPNNLEYARERLKDAPCEVRLFHANFAELKDVLTAAGIPAVDRILADLGLSTNQLFDERYGLSFGREMPLDMRIDPRIPRNARDLVNQMDEESLANVLYQNAQERYSRRIARKIVAERRVAPINSTERLADLIRSVIPKQKPDYRRGVGAASAGIDPATRSFLALRMEVNREMQNLDALLEQGPLALKPGGRLGIISFQSMEDRSVKQAFRSAEQTGLVRILTKKPISPAENELRANPRSRSAKLRVTEKI